MEASRWARARTLPAPTGRLRLLSSHPPVWPAQAAKFLLVGVLNTALDLALYVVLTRWLGLSGSGRAAAKGTSYGAGIVNSFYWNRRWTFRVQAGAAAFGGFVIASLAAMVINAGVMYLSLQQLGVAEACALALATGSSLVCNFATSKWLIFKP